MDPRRNSRRARASIRRKKCSTTVTAAFCHTCCGRSSLANNWIEPETHISVFLIANEKANSGRAAGLIPAARAALESVGGATLLLTQARRDEGRCAHEAVEKGASTIAVLGGDGTISQVACELVRLGSRIPIAIFSAGTGNDFAKSLPMPTRDFRAMASLIAAKRMRTIDVGKIADTIFVNSAGFGFDAEVVARVMKAGGAQRKSMYVLTALGQLFRYPGFDARVRPPGADAGTRVVSARWLTMVFANGAWFGGGFQIAPDATISDGFLDAVFIRDASPGRRAMIFATALGGRHTGLREVAVSRNSRWTIEFSAPPVYQADGELWQAPSATVDIAVLPKVLRIVA